MKKAFILIVVFTLFVAPAWAVTANELVSFFENSQDWVKSAMIAFKVQKKASDARIADMYDFVADQTYDYEGMLINGAKYLNTEKGQMANLLDSIQDGVLAVIHKLATDDNKKLFKPTWIGYHTPGDKRVSNWFCLIMGSHIKTYLTRIDQKSKLDEIGADPLQMNVLNKNLYDFQIVKDLGEKAVMKVTPKQGSEANFREAQIEVARLKVGDAETWYVTKISGVLNTGASGETEFGNFRVAAAQPGEYIGWSDDDKSLGKVPTWGIATALQQKVRSGQKLFVFATQIKTTTIQNSKDIKDYEVSLLTNVKRLHINPTTDIMVKYITPARLGTLEKISKKVVSAH